MEETGPIKTFYDLPEALVQEFLEHCTTVSNSLTGSFTRIYNEKEKIRQKLTVQSLLHRDSDISSFPMNPTSCGVDGAYAIEKLLSTDLAVTAAVAVEGLSPPKEKRYWPNPKHLCLMQALPHSEASSKLLSGIMMCMELQLTAQAPHDVVMLDGSMTTPLIYINQALPLIENGPKELTAPFKEQITPAIEATKKILWEDRSDKIFVASPKYTTRKELAEKIGLPGYEDRGLLSLVLQSGEYVGPIDKETASRPGYIANLSQENREFVNDYVNTIREMKIVYYRPFIHVPVLRLEVTEPVARNTQRLALLFEAIRIQCGAASIFEPYPLYMADRMVKHLRTVLPALRRTATQSIAENWIDDPGLMFMAMHGYRTESGE